MSIGGRGVLNRKTRVDEVRSIDVLDLQHKGFFAKGAWWNWTSTWSRNEEIVASISCRLKSADSAPVGVRFMYTIKDNDSGEKKDYNYVIPAVSTSCNYGGERWWFVCPLVFNGRACQRRCRIVYMPPGAKYFGCRECYRLTYESRQRHRGKFYEGFEKPYNILENAGKQLKRIRSPRKLEAHFRKIRQAQASLKSFESSF